jgi:hypothetical protein
MSAEELRSPLTRLLLLALAQKFMRYLTRSIWVGGAVYLILWSLNSAFSWLPEERTRLVITIIAASIWLILTFIPIPDLRRFAWRLDRGLQFNEQISSALLVEKEGDRYPLHSMLILEAGEILKQARKRMLARGWSLLSELEALAVVAVMGLIVYSAQAMAVPDIPAEHIVLLPPLEREPSAEEVIPWEAPEADQSAMNETGDAGPDQADSPSSDEMAFLETALGLVGDALAGDAATADLGEALQSGDLGSASHAMEKLADHVPDLSSESQTRMANIFFQAAEALSPTSMEEFSEDLSAAANALNGTDASEKSAALDALADDLLSLSGMMDADTASFDGLPTGSGTAGAGSAMDADSRELGGAETFTRIASEGETFELEPEEDESGMLSPGAPDIQAGERTISGEYERVQAGDSSVINSMLTPYHYSWIWRDVVARYFSR